MQQLQEKKDYKKRYKGEGVYDYYLDLVLDWMADKNYCLYPLGKTSYRIDFPSCSFLFEFSMQYRNIQVFKMNHGEERNYETMLIVSVGEIKELCLGYRQMCEMHGILKPIKKQVFKQVFSQKERNQIQAKMKKMLFIQSQENKKNLQSIF